MATRLYFANTAPNISPTPHSQWGVAGPYNYATLVTSPTNTAYAEKSKSRGSGVTVQVPQVQLISGTIAKGTNFTTSDTFMTVARTREGTTNHDASSCVSIRILSSTGVEQAVLYTENIIGLGTTQEWATSLTNRKFPRAVADNTGTALQTNYTTVAGDRLEVTLGSRIGGDFGGGFVEVGDLVASTDLVHNNTANTQNRPWFELSNNFDIAGGTIKTKTSGTFTAREIKYKSGGTWSWHAYRNKDGGSF